MSSPFLQPDVQNSTQACRKHTNQLLLAAQHAEIPADDRSRSRCSPPPAQGNLFVSQGHHGVEPRCTPGWNVAGKAGDRREYD